MRFLIVDDNKEITDPLGELIAEEGHDCMISNNGREGMKLIKEQIWDGVLLDLAIPDLSGKDIIETLVKENKIKQSKIIIFTASSTTDAEIAQLITMGVHSFLRKPTSVENVLNALGI